MIIAEEGDPINWNWTVYRGDSNNNGNEKIVDLYRKHLKVVDECEQTNLTTENKCHTHPYSYKYLNGETGESIKSANAYQIYQYCYQFILLDGAVIGLSFKNMYNAVLWANPDLMFTIDLNGKSGPNKIGRDVFFLYLQKNEHGSIKPFTDRTFDLFDYRNTCNTDSSGYSCAYKIFQERKMNY